MCFTLTAHVSLGQHIAGVHWQRVPVTGVLDSAALEGQESLLQVTRHGLGPPGRGSPGATAQKGAEAGGLLRTASCEVTGLPYSLILMESEHNREDVLIHICYFFL